MDKLAKQQVISEAFEYWNAGRLIEAGQTIFESIPVAYRHRWAAEILQVASQRFPKLAEVDAVLEFATTPDKYGRGRESNYSEAHRIVDAVNWRDSLILKLATQVGKVVYTAQQYPAPYDHNAGWRIVEVLKQIVQQVNDADFAKTAWATLCNEKYIELDKPVMCHPACPVCYTNGLVSKQNGA